MNCSLDSAQHFQLTFCLIHLLYFIRKQQDNGHYTVMIILDLQKVFDTVNHKILLVKLWAMGVVQNGVQWFNLYLSAPIELTYYHRCGLFIFFSHCLIMLSLLSMDRRYCCSTVVLLNNLPPFK